MKIKTKMIVGLLLAVSVLAGTIFSGCADSVDYSKEIRDYQERLEALKAENEELRNQLAELEIQEETEVEADTETEAETETETEAPSEEETTPESESESESQIPEEEETVLEPEVPNANGILRAGDVTNVLVFGDSIWANDRDESGIAARVEKYLADLGYRAHIYNASIGGTRATIDFADNEWEYDAKSNNSLGKMLSILAGNTDVELIAGLPAYQVMQEVMPVKNQVDLVILAYGMNDFLSQAEKNCSERHWCGYGTALVEALKEIRRQMPGADIMVIGPTYASHFPIGVQNMGDKALFNYARVAQSVIEGNNVLGIDPYNQLGIDMYNADDYLEDGIHLNALGRDLYARAVVGNMVFGELNVISGNAMPWEAFE